MAETLADLGLTLTGTWPPALRRNLRRAVFRHIGADNLKLWLNGQNATLHFGGPAKLAAGSYYGRTSGSRITFYANGNTNPIVNVLHEFGHLVDNLWKDFFTKELQKVEFRRNDRYFGGWNGRKYLGLRRDVMLTSVLKDPRAGGGDAWQQRGGQAHWEDWTDIFSNAMLKNIKRRNQIGRQVRGFVDRMEAHVKGEDAAAK
jgi:hypothetical protein